MTEHIQVPLNITIYVDEGIKPLLEVLWGRGFITQYSCQGNGEGHKDAIIVFPDSSHGIIFNLFLKDNNIPSRLEPRSLVASGGAFVKFNGEDILLITKLVELSINLVHSQICNYPGFRQAQREFIEMYANSYLIDKNLTKEEMAEIALGAKVPISFTSY